MSSRLPRDEALEKEDSIDEMKKKKKNSPPVPHLLQAQQAPALPYAKVVGRPGTGSYPAPSPDPTTHILAQLEIEGNILTKFRINPPSGLGEDAITRLSMARFTKSEPGTKLPNVSTDRTFLCLHS